MVVYESCCQTTLGIGGIFGISSVSGLSHAAPEWKRGISSLKFGLQLEHSHLSRFGHFSIGLGFVLPVVYFGEAACSLRLLQNNISVEWLVSPQVSKKLIDRPRASDFLIISIVCVGIVGNFFVEVRVFLTTTIIIVVIVSTIRVISGLVFFSFELAALIP